MTVRWKEGFDYMPTGAATVAAVANVLNYADYQAMNYPASVSVVSPGRFAFGKCAYLTSSNSYLVYTNLRKALPASMTEGYFGCAVMKDITGVASAFSFIDGVNNVEHVRVTLEPNGVIKAWYAGTVGTNAKGTLLATSDVSAYITGSWFYLEIHVKIHATLGAVEVRVNTVPVITYSSGNTKNGAGTTFGAIEFGQDTSVSAAGFSVDDIYLVDPAGSVNNAFLGNTRCQLQAPDSAGAATVFSPSNGALANWQNVLNGNVDDTLYVYSPNVGDEDLYNTNSIVNSPTIFAIGVKGAYRQTDATQRFSKNVIKSGTTISRGASSSINQSYKFVEDIWELDPNTGSGWTPTAVNALQIGPRVDS